ncbi:hypothetical protein BCR35DRAFT_309938 [Leucosporidium creatinivorum]|uniref:Uncharacterized protein n=1 Tax=Leucosporidium creatinivorum TaxID=106004 RepID=A0A1Y2D9N6_9BASI|nr:hypothetical protein BCR35DRAFT_309938 [Leucosporidium creatinivorum]
MGDPHHRPSPYRPSSPRGGLTSWPASSSSASSVPPQVYQAGPAMGEHDMDPYLQQHQYQQQVEHQHAHFYRQPAPSSLQASASHGSAFNSPVPSLSTTSDWGTALVDPSSLQGPPHYDAYPGPSSAWDAQRGGLATVGSGANVSPTTNWEHLTVGHALAGLTASSSVPPIAAYEQPGARADQQSRFSNPWNHDQAPNGQHAMPSPSFNPPPSSYYDPSASSTYVIPNGVPLPLPLSGEVPYSHSGSYSEVLPNTYQTYSPDPYSSSNHSRVPSITNASPASHPAASTSISPSALSKPAPTNYSPRQPPPQQQHSRKGPPPPLHDPLPAYSSSHTFSYPETYPPRSLSGSSASTVTASPASPPSTAGSHSNTSQPPHAAVVAANNRIRLASMSAASGSASGSSTPRKPVAKKPSNSTRHALELAFGCRFCGVPIAKLTLRGGGTPTSGRHEGTYYCPSCVPLPAPPPPQNPHLNAEEEEASYADTLSAAVDRLEGISVEDSDPRPPPANRYSGGGQSLSGSTSKKRTKSDEESLQCDVCKREIATGALRLVGGHEGEKFECTVEVLCTHCEGRYLRCSDCGGGGGTRGVGRWRAKELFPEGRRTCQLSHVRMGTLNDMTYDVWPITSIPASQTATLIKLCRELYFSTLLSTLAVPDMMESHGAIARSYEEVMKQATDSWTVFEPLITEDIEAARSTRRYIALRWTSPASRKSKYKGKKEDGDSPPPPASNMNQPPTLIREGKVLAGYILGECDLLLGSLHVALTMPTGSGESYDAASRLMQSMFRHVQNDIASINFARQQQSLPPMPLLKQAWSLHMIKKDSRIMSRIETRRGFLPVDDYLAKYPDSSRTDFAPARPVFFPPELLKGWHVYVKRVTEDDEWLASGHRKGSGSGRLEM